MGMNEPPPTTIETDEVVEDEAPAIHIVRGERACLSCGDKFISEGWHNRLCLRCRKRSAADYF